MRSLRRQSASRRWFRGDEVPLSAIRRYVGEVVRLFDPDKVVLFGSHAYGRPHAESDVDLLVVMPTTNQLDQAVKIDRAVDRNFPLDLIVRTPKNLEWRVREGDYFLREILTRGKVLHEKADA